jgi:hypothetical protein
MAKDQAFPLHARPTDSWEAWKAPDEAKNNDFVQRPREMAVIDQENLWFLCCGAGGENQASGDSSREDTAIRILREQQCEHTKPIPMIILTFLTTLDQTATSIPSSSLSKRR